MKQRIKAIIFDKDGTLFHYGHVWGSVIAASLEKELPTDNLSDQKREDCLIELERIVGIDRYGNSYRNGLLFRHDKTIEAIFRLLILTIRYRLKVVKVFKAFISLAKNADVGLSEKFEIFDFSKTVEAIERCYKKGYILGMVTNDKKASVDMFLKKIDPNGRISYIATGDGECKKKPYPEAAEKFLKDHNLESDELCIVGDTIIDMVFARRAKAGRKIALLSGSGDAEGLSKRSDALYEDITGMLSDPVLFG